MAIEVMPGVFRQVTVWPEERSESALPPPPPGAGCDRAGGLPAKAGQVLEAVLVRGDLPRADVPALLNTGERQARTLAPRWMPGLFPEKPS
jgi:hypothetical protein